MTTTYTGHPQNRVDGRAKVTGTAAYAGEYRAPDLVYGVVVSSSIAKGSIVRLDLSEALAQPGVLQVFTHQNAPRLALLDRHHQDDIAPPGSPFRPLQDGVIRFSGQPVALVVANSFEAARHAAALVHIEYQVAQHTTDLRANRDHARKPKERSGMAPAKPRGDAEAAFASAPVQVDAEYYVPVEHHNPMEPFAATVVYSEDGRLTVHDKTQGVVNVHRYLCNIFSLSKDKVRVLSPYVGGAFGSGLRPQYHVVLAVLAARELKRSVRVVLTRQQMFTFGHRPETLQRVALGATPDQRLGSVIHEVVSETSQWEDYSENVVNWSGLLYQCDHVRLDHKVVPLDVYTPMDMRAPGAVWGMFALETAMDELAVKLGADPIALRLKNYAERDQNENLPFSSKELRECYRLASEKFGWAGRNPAPRSMERGRSLIGWGMAGGAWEAQQEKAGAKATLTADGRLIVASASADIGTGTYTIMSQIAAEALGLPISQVSFKLGDSLLPEAPVEGGSFTASTVGSAVQMVCEKLQAQLLQLAQNMDGSVLAGAKLKEVRFADGQIQLRSDPARSVSLHEAMRHGEVGVIEAVAAAKPSRQQQRFSRYAHSAVLVEVSVDKEFGTIRVNRAVSAVAAGRILNPKTARSQVMGGVVWGISSALHEKSVMDHQFGRFMNHNLAEYHIPVNADIQDIDVLFVEEKDAMVNPLGVKGIGEIGLVGVAAAIGNAIYHATGKRLRTLPFTLDQLIGA